MLDALEACKNSGDNTLGLKGIKCIWIGERNEQRSFFFFFFGLIDKGIGLAGATTLSEVLKTNTRITTLSLWSKRNTFYDCFKRTNIHQ